MQGPALRAKHSLEPQGMGRFGKPEWLLQNDFPYD
jgi:hypothetical protein